MFLDSVKLTGNLNIDHYNAEGSIINRYNYNNLVVTRGKEFMTSRMAGATLGVMSHMAVGSGDSVATAADTILYSQISDRVALTSTTVVSNVITYVGTFGPGVCTGAITEAGIFNAATVGDMLARTVFGVINKSGADTVIITWTVTIS